MKAFELVRLNNGGRMKRAAGPPAGLAEYYSLDSISTENIDILLTIGPQTGIGLLQGCGLRSGSVKCSGTSGF